MAAFVAIGTVLGLWLIMKAKKNGQAVKAVQLQPWSIKIEFHEDKV